MALDHLHSLEQPARDAAIEAGRHMVDALPEQDLIWTPMIVDAVAIRCP